jgi:ubiquinone/menaquinone biosynthesis C-methylase UbiE
MVSSQQEIDRRNREFWDELCGTSLARSLGITESSPNSLARFDDAYMSMYPYLPRYVAAAELTGKRVLEIGLGYGTLGQILARHASAYIGVDIARGPTLMMQHRLDLASRPRETAAVQASALDLPFPDRTFDCVYTIGCLHHTGDLSRAVAEVHRVLVPRGRAVVMLYHRHSFRLLCHAPRTYFKELLPRRSAGGGAKAATRRVYDTDSHGESAPHTEFVSRREARHLFQAFARVRVESQNFDGYVLFKGRLVVPRERLLRTLGRVLGLDLYVVATK